MNVSILKEIVHYHDIGKSSMAFPWVKTRDNQLNFNDIASSLYGFTIPWPSFRLFSPPFVFLFF